jgi:hypothetical protein
MMELFLNYLLILRLWTQAHMIVYLKSFEKIFKFDWNQNKTSAVVMNHTPIIIQFFFMKNVNLFWTVLINYV